MVEVLEAVLPVLAAVLGALVGGGVVYVANATQLRQQASVELARDRRRLLARHLAETHSLFESVRSAYKERSSVGSDSRAIEARLSEVTTASARGVVDEIRMIATTATVHCAEALMSHLRHSGLLSGHLDSPEFRAWVDSYWQLRHRLIQVARAELLPGGDDLVIGKPHANSTDGEH